MSEAETKTKWVGRVRAWRESGASAVSFAAEQGFAPSTLRWWDSKLTRAAKPPVAMARVVRAPSDRPRSASTGAATLAIELDGVQIAVRRGFDADLLRQVVLALGGGR